MRRAKLDKDINFKRNLGEYFGLVFRHKRLFWSLSILVLFIEALFIFDKFLYKRIIDDAELFVQGTLSSSIFVNTLLIILAVYFAITVLRSIGAWFRMYLMARLSPLVTKDLKEKYFQHILSLDHKFHTTHKTGSLISRLNRGTSATNRLLFLFVFQLSPLILQLILVVISLAMFTTLPAIILVITSFTFVLYSVRLQNIQKKSRIAWNKTMDRENGFIADVFTNVDSIKYYGKEKKIGLKYSLMAEKTKRLGTKFFKFFANIDSGQSMILALGTIAMLFFPLRQFLAGEITLGLIVFIYALYGTVVGNLYSFTYGIQSFYEAMADIQDLFEYGKSENGIKDKDYAKKLDIQRGEIEFKNVGFKYEKTNLFNNFNLKVKTNEKVALVGHSGCGKTTIVKLLNRFYDVDSGRILIDGEDIRDFKQESVRGETGIVPQECILFDDTIYNNIKFSNPSATRKEVLNAIKLAQLGEVIKNFDKKENTVVGERGVKLSGGEKQRVSVARAILADKKILVLDEATSALDSETESKIQMALHNLLKGRTSIMIAHRLSTIMDADRIIVMRKGKIIEQGSHNELLKSNGEYKKLWDLQKGGYLQ